MPDFVYRSIGESSIVTALRLRTTSTTLPPIILTEVRQMTSCGNSVH